MNENNVIPEIPKTDNTKSKGILITVVIITLLIAIGAVYFWQHNKVKKQQSSITNLNAQILALSKATQASSDNTNEKTTQSNANTTNDEQVLESVKNYCNALVEPSTKKPLVLKVGKAGINQKQVLYSSDKNFAYVNAVCSKDGTTEGSGSAYYLKKVNNSWVFLYHGQMTSPEYTVQFNIPSDFN